MSGGPWFPEFDYTPEERLTAVAEILLRGMRRMVAARGREKTRRWRERKAAEEAALDEGRDPSPHVDEEKPR